jgi:hypothetical protein
MAYHTLSRGHGLIGSLTVKGTLNAPNDDRLVQSATVTLTNAQVLALRATPIALVAAPGAGKANIFERVAIEFDRTGAYTESADNMAVKYTDGSGVAVSDTIESTGFVDASADAVVTAGAAASPLVTANAALVLHNTGDGEFGGGNAANVWRVTTWYRVRTLTL